MLGLVWYEAYHAYMLNHTYYYDMLATSNNRKIILWFIVLALIPVATLLRKKKTINLKQTGRAIIVAIILSWFVHTSYKWWLVWSTWSFIFLFNTVVLLSLIIIFFWGIYIIGTKLYEHFTKKTTSNWSDILLSLWLWIGIFLFINYILVLAQLFYPVLAWIQLGFLAYIVWSKNSVLSTTSSIITESLNTIYNHKDNRTRIYTILIVISLLYIMLSFNLSFIPYSTAWDANHAYMYYPKIRALNNGVFYSEWPVTVPYIWMVYISYWFSLFKPLANFTLAPDTIAVVMNNVSWWLSLIFWLGALHKVIEFFSKGKSLSSQFFNTAFSMGWMYFLLWLMSGMGAFLVFVDNKTDLGVMALTMLALLSGFMFIDHHNDQDTKSTVWYSTYGIISGIFFALAILAKPTAFQDLIIFWLLLIGLWMWILWIIGLFLLVLWVLGRAETMSIVFYISKNLATKLWIVWIMATAWQFLQSWKAKSLQHLKVIAYRWISIIAILFVFKGWYIITQQIVSSNIDIKAMAKWILLWQSTTKKDTTKTSISSKKVLVADTGEATAQITSTTGENAETNQTELSIKPEMCTLPQAWLNKESLYTGLGDIQWWGLIEDLGRYIWFGQRTFTAPSQRDKSEANNYWFIRIWYPLLKLLFHKEGCYSLNTTADMLCSDPTLWTNKNGIEKIMNTINKDSNQYKFLSGIVNQYDQIAQESDSTRQSNIQWDIKKAITDYVQWNVVQVTKDSKNNVSIAVPYAYLTPLNVIFNWSLQNLSSYYTDIWFIWILSLLLLVAGTIYTITIKEKKLLLLHIVTLCGWIIWWFIASGIIWYAVGIIAWTLFCNVLFISYLISTREKNDSIWQRTMRISLWILLLVAIIQTGLNLFRIASQWGSWPFTWYKWGSAKEMTFVFTPQWITQQEEVKTNYKASDVFNIQFWHYNSFINYTKNRKDEDGVLIAWTYLQYFLDNQNNITSDGLLTQFWQWWSDGNTCNLALRLQDKKIKYLVIDPNIGSVVMWWGNSTLFDRFVAKIDSKTNKIIQHGTMTMLVKMIQDWYLKLIMTNNMWAKYAYSLNDEELRKAIDSLWYAESKTFLLTAFDSDPLLMRSKLAVPRFFGQEAQHYFILIWQIFQSRLSQGTAWVEDLANILGKEINIKNITNALSQINGVSKWDLTQLNSTLTEDEKAVIGYYMAINSRMANWDSAWAQDIINQLLQSSLAWWSQLITFELQI